MSFIDILFSGLIASILFCVLGGIGNVLNRIATALEKIERKRQ